jgi:nucleotide-binding universal stress UspA family protein
MYKKMLVPLDGSKLSECSLDHVKAVASGCRVPKVVLLRVVEPLSAQTISALSMAGGDLLRRAEMDSNEEARLYMGRIKKRLARQGLAVETAIVDGRPADEILNYAKKEKVDLIVIATHGRSGISGWVFGSVAEKVLHHSAIPVLMITPSGCRTGA